MKMITPFYEASQSTSITNKKKHIDVSVLLASGATSLDDWFPSFQESVILLSASVENFQLIGLYQLSASAPYSRRKKISLAPLLDLQSSKEADVVADTNM